MTQLRKHIGLVGGVGPVAGLELFSSILANTPGVTSDQDHLSVTLVSPPSTIPDRTAYLLGEGPSPILGLFEAISALVKTGAEIVAIPCNTAHAPAILDRVLDMCTAAELSFEFYSILDAVMAEIRANPTSGGVGILGTHGTYASGIYETRLKEAGLCPVLPSCSRIQHNIHSAIYDPETGIKGRAGRDSMRARNLLIAACEDLAQSGAKTIIMGCTEIPLCLSHIDSSDIRLIDPSAVLARRLIAAALPPELG